MDLDTVLSQIKDKAIKEIITEFKELIATGKKDAVDIIKQTALQVEKALILQAEGKLDSDDVQTLLRKQKKIAQIAANTAKITVLSRIQKVAYRILDIAIDVLTKAI